MLLNAPALQRKERGLPVIAQNYLLGNVTEPSPTGNLTHVRDKVKEVKEENTYKSAPKPNRSPARRVRFGKKERRNE